MAIHYTRNTLECTVYCNPCGEFTQHRVDDGRQGPCLKCIAKLEEKSAVERIRRGIQEEEAAEQERQNPRLF
jgi:ribosomal protein L44E